MSHLSPEQVEELFHAALARPAKERSAWLESQAPPEIVREVSELLAAHSDGGAYLEQVVAGAAASALELDPLLGSRVDSYRVVRLIGRGGMGSVYLAERADDEFEQRVALKVVGAGMSSPEIVERFRSERQILARLDHPNIARLFDGGTTRDGIPYLVMEYVEGAPIDAYADTRDLGVRARLHLFQRVCTAIHYAHQSLVVHRDIKPSNILISSDGTPKLLDFGIAKLLDPVDTHQTMTAQRLLTPQHASPEQVRGEPITTASDVYSLGILLYTLLAGEPPYRLQGVTAREVERVVCEVDPKPPSAVRRLPADLDTIALMALQKEPARRYGTAAELADDVQRFLDGHAVRAQRNTWRYRAGKFIARNRLAVSAAIGAIVILAGFAVTMTVQAGRLAKERERAEAKRLQAEHVSEFLVGLFSSSDPGESRGATITARELLDRGADKIMADLENEPETQAHLLDTVAEVYRKLGLYDESVRLFEQALVAQRRAFGDEHANVAMSSNNLAGALMNQARFAEAQPHLERALALNRAILGDGQEVAANLANLGWALRYQGKLAAAEAYLRESLAIDLARAGEDDEDTAGKLYSLAQVLQLRGKLAEAVTLMRRSLEVRRALLGEDHPSVAESTYGLASIREDLGDYTGAQKLFERATAIDRKVYGSEHPYIAADLASLGHLALERGRPQAAVARYREALAMKRKFFGEEHPDVALTVGRLGWAMAAAGDLTEGERLVREGLRRHRAAAGAEHPDNAPMMAKLGRIQWRQGDLKAAAATLRQALELSVDHLGGEHPSVARIRMRMARVLLAAGDVASATREAREALDRLRETLPAEHPTLSEARAIRGACLIPSDPATAVAVLRTSAEALRAAFGAEDARARAAIADLAHAESRRQ